MRNPNAIPGLILSAGGIVVRGDRTIIVLHRSRTDWTLPRGKLKRGETPLQAAIRETTEETGYAARAFRYAGAVSYEVSKTPKVVLYWLMRVSGRQGEVDGSEIAEARWVTIAGAKKFLSFPDEFALLKKVWP